jgi:MPBQ/MSBQ methyltransferase
LQEALMAEEIEGAVQRHYGIADLGSRILAALSATGVDVENLTVNDLAPVDEFHIGGREATEHLIAKLGLTGSERVIDVGCGIGGAARVLASRVVCRVEGLDLTPEFIDVARDLTKRAKLSLLVSYTAASALAMPYPPARFDAAMTLHAAMNIADREGLYREVARVLKPGALFAVYDVMRGVKDGLDFPMPWAETPATSFLKSPDETRALLEAAGFTVLETEDRTAAAIQFFKERMAAMASGPSPLGPHLVMGSTARVKLGNLMKAVEQGAVAPVVMIARRT